MTSPASPHDPPPPAAVDPAPGGTGDRYSLLLFVSGASTSSARAIRNVRELCERHLAGRFALTVVDVRQDDALSRLHQVLATPTLVRQSPPPQLVRVGDFSDHHAVLSGLDIQVSADA